MNPWEAYAYDPNDNAGRTHAAQSATYQTHWNTPTSVKVDALGRAIESIKRNGINPLTQWFRTVSTYDIRGNLLTVTDPLGRPAFAHVYDLRDNALRSETLDAGVRRHIQDAAGNLIEQRGSKGALTLNSYDELNRLVHRHYDEAGLLEVSEYDFKDNILAKSRKTIRDDVVLSVFAGPPANWQVNAFRVDWQPPIGSELDAHAATLLDATVFHTSLRYDALDRVKLMIYPEDVVTERKELLPDGSNTAGVR